MKYNGEKRKNLEELIIATMINYNKKYLSLDELFKLDESHFRNDFCKDTIIAINNLIEKGKKADLENVPFEFKKKYAHSIGPTDHFVRIVSICTNGGSSTLALEEYILKLKEYVMVDKMETMFFKFERLNFDDADIIEFLDNAKVDIEEVQSLVEVNTSHSMLDNIKTTMDLITRNTKKFIKKGIIGVPTGYDNIDSFSGGFLDEELIVLGARPSMGKTVAMLNFATNASERGYKPYIFSLETSRTALVLKIIANRSGIDSKKLFLGKADDVDFNKINSSIGAIEGTNMMIEDSTYSLDAMVSKIRFNKAKSNIDIVFIDYLQLIKTTRGHSREQEVANISRTLKMLAKELRMPIVALSQLGRPPKGMIVKRPNLTDLRESGAIEQDSDTVIFIHRPEYYYEPGEIVPDEEVGITEFIFRKGRNIGVGLFKLKFEKALARFVELNIF